MFERRLTLGADCLCNQVDGGFMVHWVDSWFIEIVLASKWPKLQGCRVRG